MKVFKVPQLSVEWWELRRGIPTASEFSRIITAAKGDPSSSAGDYAAELIGDIVCQNPAYFTEKGKPANSYAIQNGKDREPEARRWYELESGYNVAEVGFVMSDDFRVGCSPDGVIGLQLDAEPAGEYRGIPFWEGTAEGLLELKVPLPGTQAKYLMRGHNQIDGSLLRDHRQQTHGQIVITGLPWVELVSYSGGQLATIRLRVMPDSYTDKVKAALDAFMATFEKAKHQFLGHPEAAT